MHLQLLANSLHKIFSFSNVKHLHFFNVEIANLNKFRSDDYLKIIVKVPEAIKNNATYASTA